MCATDTDKLQIYKACENVRCLKLFPIPAGTLQKKKNYIVRVWTNSANSEFDIPSVDLTTILSSSQIFSLRKTVLNHCYWVLKGIGNQLLLQTW